MGPLSDKGPWNQPKFSPLYGATDLPKWVNADPVRSPTNNVQSATNEGPRRKLSKLYPSPKCDAPCTARATTPVTELTQSFNLTLPGNDWQQNDRKTSLNYFKNVAHTWL